MNKNITSLVLLILFLVPVFALATNTTFEPTGSTPCSANSNAICNPLNSSDITALLTNLVDIAIPIGAIIAVIMFIYVGFKFIFAQGKPEKIKDAWKWFGYVAIGTAILIGAKVIVSIMESTLTSAGLVKQGLLPSQ
jgi:type IV secretory pathway VirB2 component (pilin)